MQKLGVQPLMMRQQIANALSKAVRVGTLPKMSTSEIFAVLGEEGADANTVLMPSDLVAQERIPEDAADTQIPRLLIQTNKTRRVGRAAFRSTCDMLRHNPYFAYRFYDDDRCEKLLREHFAPSVLEAWWTLRAGAAKADLWRYCALYVHGGVYLDLDACICGPLDRTSDDEQEALLTASRPRAFMIDAEANLIQWILCAAPRDAVLLRTIEMSVARILAREPNIFVATGPSVFTDAFITHHASTHAAQVVYASRTSMTWSDRLTFLKQHGAISECTGLVRATYDGYRHEDVYVGGSQERYLPTWGSEPTRGLYHASHLISNDEDDSIDDHTEHDGRQRSGARPYMRPPTGRYIWEGEDTLTDEIDLDEVRLSWRCALVLSAPRGSSGALPPHRVRVLREHTKNTPALPTGTSSFIHYPTATFEYECQRTDSAGTRQVCGVHSGVWRHAPGRAQQLHLFEWRVADDASGAGDGVEWLVCTEAPSVMEVDGDSQLILEGWEGSASVDGLAERLLKARRSARSQTEVGLRLPLVFRRCA